MSRRRILILAAAGLVLLILAWLLRGLVYNLLVVPAQILYYYARALYLFVPHSLIWGIFIVLAYMVFLNSLYRRAPAHELRRLPPPQYAELRISQLARYIAGRKRSFYQHRLKYILTDLVIQVTVQKKRVTHQEVRNLINRQEFDAPPELQSYFKDGLVPWSYGSIKSPGLLLRLLQLRRRKKEAGDMTLRVLEYIEEQMEIERDGNSASI